VTFESEELPGIEELVQRVLALGTPDHGLRTLWFRGLPCDGHGLVPKLMRLTQDPKDLFDQEERLITRFRQRSLPFWPAGYPQDDWEHMFVMQHHGVPTRLLDWSENLFVGLYFALPTSAELHPGDDMPADHTCKPTLWCLDPVGWNRGAPHLQDFAEAVSIFTTSSPLLQPYQPATSDEKRTLMRHDTPVSLFGTHNSSRIVAQRGTFTIAGKGTNPMEHYAATTHSATVPVLWKFILDQPHDDLRRGLHRLGFSESMIFPDLPALARELAAEEF
jgi:hypothetical protein